MWERRVDAKWTLLWSCVQAVTGKFDIYRHILLATPQRDDIFSERCANAVVSPFVVTGVLEMTSRNTHTTHAGIECDDDNDTVRFKPHGPDLIVNMSSKSYNESTILPVV